MQDVIKGFGLILEFQNILLIFGGVLIGVLVGALPGLSSPMAIALLMPFTISLDPVASISMMAEIGPKFKTSGSEHVFVITSTL